MRRTIFVALAAFLGCAALVADAQVNPLNMPANTVAGRLGISPGPQQAIPFTTLAANLSTITSGTVVVQRLTNPTFEVSTWQAFGPSGVVCTSAGGSTTSCLHEADLAAFPYTLGNTSPGYDLEIRGGADPASNGTKYSGAAVLIPMSAGWTLNPMQGGMVNGHGLTFNCTITLDSLEYSEINFEGSQVTPCMAADARNGLVLNPTHPSPFDLITAIGPGRIFFQSVDGGMKITGGMAQNEDIKISELNVAGNFTSGCVYQSDTASAANLWNNRITINFLHGFNTAGMTAMCVGSAGESGGFINGRNTYDVGIGPDSASIAVNGIDTYGHDDKWVIRAQNMNSANYIIKFESGSCRNHFDIEIQGTAPSTIVNDSGSCSAANANTGFVNGQLVVNGAFLTLPTSTDTLVGRATSDTLTNKTLTSPIIGGGTAGQVVTSGGASAVTFQTPARMRYCLVGVNFNSANTDNALTISPMPTARWLPNTVRITNASASISTATIGVFTATGGGGQTIVANQAITVTSTTPDSNNNAQNLTLTNLNTEAYNDASVQIRIGTAQGSAATADVCLEVVPLT